MQNQILKMANIYPFHMPGHKRNKDFIFEDLLDLDMTEISGLDNLHNPTGIIKEAQQNCANIFQCKHSFFVVNGASSAVMAAVFSVCSENDPIIVMRNSHKSLYNTLELSGAQPFYLYGQNVFGINYGISYEELEKLLSEKTDAKAVFITSPNYEGFCLDIKKISEIVHRYKKILIVDEAHGSHFIFHDKFPMSAIKSGADIVINSLHKTLPCLTQSAVLHINSDCVDVDRVKKYLSIFQTTSPSYIFMSIIDKTLRNISEPEFYNSYVKKLVKVRDFLSEYKVFHLLNENDVRKFGFNNLDISKLTFLLNTWENIDIEKILRDEFALQIEMRGQSHFIALSTIADTDLGFEMLMSAITNIEKRFEYKKLNCCIESSIKLKTVLSLKQTMDKNKKSVELEKSLGRISADYIIPYPPGIPLIVPGEMITNEVIDFVRVCLSKNLNILGVNKDLILIV